MAVKIQVEVFWVVTPCGVVVGYQHFKVPYCLRFHFIMKIQVEFFCVVTPCSVVVGYLCFRGPCFHHLQGEVTMIAA
jgi:hypothetical protein